MAGEAGPSKPPASKADKFMNLQLRSVLDDPTSGDGAGADTTWAQLLSFQRLVSHAEVGVLLSLPSTALAEESLLQSVDKLTKAMIAGVASPSFCEYYRSFGWQSAEAYFEELGEAQIMLVDIDHNDADDRLAIILLAYQMASANMDRRSKDPKATCTLYLDGRTYQNSGITIWRTLRLSIRLHALLRHMGLSVEPVFTDLDDCLAKATAHLGTSATKKADSIVANSGSTLQATGPGSSRPNLVGAFRGSVGGPPRMVAIWILSGVCKEQVEDIRVGCQTPGIKLVIYEQAQPAWHSCEVPKTATRQPSWFWPPSTEEELEKGFGVEPSNIRSGEKPYNEILETYLSLQKVVAEHPSQVIYVCPALARSDATMPAPCGQIMHKVSGRPLTVLPGDHYIVKKALDPARTEKVFNDLVTASRVIEDTSSLYSELLVAAADDKGVERQELKHIVKYGTFMADAILIALAARPLASFTTDAVVRRLAVVEVRADDCTGQAPPVASEAHVGESSQEEVQEEKDRHNTVQLLEGEQRSEPSGCFGMSFCSPAPER